MHLIQNRTVHSAAEKGKTQKTEGTQVKDPERDPVVEGGAEGEGPRDWRPMTRLRSDGGRRAVEGPGRAPPRDTTSQTQD